MPDKIQSKLISEATSIFLRLRDDPENAELQAERDRFLAQGDAARQAYAKMLHAWQITDVGKRPGPSAVVAALAISLALAGAYWAYEPLRVALLSDVSTRHTTLTAVLGSGDGVILDAGTALVDQTDEGVRAVNVLRGAAYFDVESEPRAFVVTVGEARIEVTGTTFEAGHREEGGVVTVTEGSVDVALGQQSWALSVGDQLTWSDAGDGRVARVDVDTSVGWRSDVLVADTMTLAEIADTLERRMPGEIVIASASLRERAIVGTFDLSDPHGTLRLLADLTGASVTVIPSVVTILRP